ncbi:cyclodeaminase [Candidatus Bipolaricaulota bacterium]|nr:cyclodeaminase [Candidatus Bipolaricaulota bacterium]
MKVKILSEVEIRQSVTLDEQSIEVVEEGFSRLEDSEVHLPPIMMVEVPEHRGEVDVKSAHIQGYDSFAVKIASGFFENAEKGLPTGSGMMVLISAETGFPQAVLLDNAYLTNLRTGAAGAVAASYLAPEEINQAGVIGSGVQARFQIKALREVRDFDKLAVYSRNSDHVDEYAREMGKELECEIVKAQNPEQIVENSDFVVTTTPAKEPYLKGEWLHPGLHITAMGSDTETKQELFPDVFSNSDYTVCDRKSQCFRLGELHYAREAGILTEDDEITELGEITSGRKPGRTSPEQTTVCDLTGVGVQDTVIASLAYQQAVERDLGLEVEF